MKTRPTRRGQRHPIAVDVEVTNLELGILIKERTVDLSLHGCGVSTATPFPTGTKVMLKVVHGGQEIIVFGKVIYGRRDIGMGIVFTMIEPHDRELLEDWFAE